MNGVETLCADQRGRLVSDVSTVLTLRKDGDLRKVKAMNMQKDFLIVWTEDNWNGHTVFNGRDLQKTERREEAHHFTTFEAAMNVVRQIEKKHHPAGFDNVKVYHFYEVGWKNIRNDTVYRGKLDVAYAA